MFTAEELHLILVALNTAAVVSKQHGHSDQATLFTDLATKVEKEKEALQ